MKTEPKLNVKEIYEETGILGNYTLGFTADGITSGLHGKVFWWQY